MTPKKKRFNLIPDWRCAPKFISVQSDIITVAVASAWLVVPDDMRAAVPDYILAACAIALAVFGAVGRIIKQNFKGRDK